MVWKLVFGVLVDWFRCGMFLVYIIEKCMFMVRCRLGVLLKVVFRLNRFLKCFLVVVVWRVVGSVVVSVGW